MTAQLDGSIRLRHDQCNVSSTIIDPAVRLTSDVEELTDAGYRMRVMCWCGLAFERWVTRDAEDRDLLRSRLLAFPN
jgi:hypothetical protein